GRLANAAVAAYVHGGASSFIGNMARADGDNMIVRQQYLRVTASDQRQIIGELRKAKEDLALRQTELDGQKKAARTASEEAGAASREAEAAQADQQALRIRRRGPGLVRLLRPHHAGLGGGGREPVPCRRHPVLRDDPGVDGRATTR